MMTRAAEKLNRLQLRSVFAVLLLDTRDYFDIPRDVLYDEERERKKKGN